MKAKKLPPKEFLDLCFDMQENGSLFWKQRPIEHFKNQRAWAVWNAKWAYKLAGRKMPLSKYRQVGISGERYLEHRIVAVMNGLYSDGDLVIDHIDGDGENNAHKNLRVATQKQNCANRGGWAKKSLRCGVFLSENGKFKAGMRINGKQKHLGTFDRYIDACAAREAAEKIHHGCFAKNHLVEINEQAGLEPVYKS